MSASTFNWLAGLLDPLLDPDLAAQATLPAPSVLALAVSRLATGESYPSLAARFRVSVTAARAALRRVRRVLLANYRFWLAFPPADEIPAIAGVDGCCGAVACTRMGSDGQRVAAQLVADKNARIINLICGLRGDRSDFSVLKMSSLYGDMEEGKLLSTGQFLVGDGEDYPLLNWLMVPFTEPAAGSAEENFNAMHAVLCRPVWKAVASLSGWGVFRCLNDEDGPKATAACIGTCAMLHNALLTREDFSALASDEDCEAAGRSSHGHARAAEKSIVVDTRALEMRQALVVKSKSFRLLGDRTNS